VLTTGYKFTVMCLTETGTNIYGAKDLSTTAWTASVIGGRRRVDNNCFNLSQWRKSWTFEGYDGPILLVKILIVCVETAADDIFWLIPGGSR
jgi:hypothetical protein